MIRVTTNSVLKNYRYNLNRSINNLEDARQLVLTGRNFNSFAEDPSAAAQSFKLRRSYLRTKSQYEVSQAVNSKYQAAWSTLETVVNDVDNRKGECAKTAELVAGNDPTASGRNALGKNMEQLAEGIIQAMNGCKYGDSFSFAGADGLNVPFTWENKLDADGNVVGKQLCYRKIPVDISKDDNPEQYALLESLTTEKKFMDIGLGLQEDENGKLIESSAFDASLPGINFLGYGTDEDGDPKNVVSIINQMGEILSRCSENGTWATEDDEKDFRRLMKKFETSADGLKVAHTELATEAKFLSDNEAQLKETGYTLNEHIMNLDQVDTAEAITSFIWAQYSYNASLQMGTSVLGQSLMDYLN